MKSIIIYLTTIAIGFALCYASIQGYLKTTTSAEIVTFCLGFLLIILGIFSGAELISKSLKNKICRTNNN